MVDWEEWRTLLSVARTGSLNGAAALIGVDATTVGRRLQRLERRLQRKLTIRSKGRLELTQMGNAILPRLEQAEAALRAADISAEAGAVAAPWRTVRVTAVPSLCDYLLAPAVPRLTKTHRIALEIVAEDRNLSLTRREADLALRLGPTPGSRGRKLGALAYACYGQRGADPGNLPWATLDAAQAHLPEVRFVEATAGRQGVRHRASSMGTLHALVAAGAAKSLLPCFIGDGDTRLVRLSEPGAVERPLWLLGHPTDEAAPSVMRVAEWIAELCRDLSPQSTVPSA